MAELIVTRPMTINGKQFKAGDRVPPKVIERLPAGRVKQMVAQRRFEESSVRVSGKGD